MTTHSEKCPICEGEGYLPNTNPESSVATKPCHGCGGNGWITVSDEPCEADVFKPGEEVVQEIMEERAEVESNIDSDDSFENNDEEDEAGATFDNVPNEY